MTGKAQTFANGASFLIVEDDALIVMMIEFMLNEAGAQSIAVANSVAEATTLIEANVFDVAIFDRQLRDGVSYPVAILARERGTAIIVASGSNAVDLPDELADVIVLPKPFEGHQLEKAVAAALERR